MEPLAPIPTSPAQRWREFRIQALPILTFMGALSCVVLLWREFVVPINIAGEVESTRALVISVVPGTIKEIKVQRFQHVKAGDEIALISTADLTSLRASLRVIEAAARLTPAVANSDAILEDIKVQEEELRALEGRITSLKSPIDGVVTQLDYQPGSKIMPNIPIAVISGVQARRIISYVRRPFSEIPKPGDTVQIRRHTSKREIALGTVLDVAGQFELISTTLVSPKSGSLPAEVGLPFTVSIPPGLTLLPGEPVDLIFSKR
jgi:multidrug resistance efflux pump